MSTANFSDLQSTLNASSGSQLLLRLDNGLSGVDGFNRINVLNFEKSLNIYSSVESFSANWNSVYTSVQTNSASWDGVSSLSATAWVDKLGNNSTGEIGNIEKPYLTLQAAYDAGAKILHIGAGTFDGITKSSNIDFSFIGSGKDITTITSVSAFNTSANTYNITIQDLGQSSATISNIYSVGANVGATVNGKHGGNLSLANVKVSTVDVTGGVGGNGNIDIPGGFPGGNGGNITVNGSCYITYLYNKGGTGGTAFDDGNDTSGGIGGNGGDISGDNLFSSGLINCDGGGQGTSVNGGASSGGSPGNINLSNLEAVSVLCKIGSSINGANNSSILLKKAYINNLDVTNDSVGSPGDIDGACIYIETLVFNVSNPPTISAVISYIDGTAYGTL